MHFPRSFLHLAAVIAVSAGALLVNAPANAGGWHGGGWGWGGPRVALSFGWPLYYPYYAPRYYAPAYYPPYAYAPPRYPNYPPSGPYPSYGGYPPSGPYPSYGNNPPSGPYPSYGNGPPQNGYSAPGGYPPPPPQDMAQSAAPAQQTWYYCDNPQGYYPDVETCSSQWRPVPASPAGPPTPPPQ
jgi:hypothetical protein